jgi:opacity protein-like surface antigen
LILRRFINMSTHLLSGVALSMLVLAAVPAQAEDMAFKPYISVFAGKGLLDPVDTSKLGAIPYSFLSETGYLLGGAIGLQVSDHLRAEIEVSHGVNPGEGYIFFANAVKPATGTFSTTYLLANIWLDIPTDTSFTPYVGGGLGAGWASGDLTFNSNGFGYADNVSGAALAYQVGVGVKLNVSENVSLDVGYRFKGIGSTDFGDRHGGVYYGGKMASHIVQVGLTYKF